MLTAWLALSAGAKDPVLRADLSRVRPTRAALDLVLDPASTSFTGVEDLDLEVRGRTRSIRLNAADLEIGSATATAGGSPVPVTVGPSEGGWIALSLGRAVSGAVRLRFEYRGLVSDTETQGVFRQHEGDDWYLFTEFEPSDARRMFPGFDQPDAKIPWAVTVHVPDGLGAFANTSAIETADEDGPLTRVRFAETRPLPSYLVALAVGPFEVVDAGPAGRNHVPVRILTPRGEAGWAGWAAEETPQLLGTLEDWFDVPYAYDKLDIVSMPEAVGFSAMENPGLITCVQTVALGRPEDDSVDRQRTYVEVAAHEMSHLWFGDLVTLRWWDDLWLNEAFASWMGTRVIEQTQPGWRWDLHAAVSRNASMEADSLVSARRIREPIRTADDVENAFDGITYYKGEAVLRMFESWLGEDTFRKGVHDYLVAHADGNATASDFVGAMSGAAGRNFAPVFSTFLDQAGAPVVTLTPSADGRSVGLAQERFLPAGSKGSAKQRWQVPVCLRWADDAGEHRSCELLAKRADSVALEGSGPVRWLLPNAGATGYYRTRLDPDRFSALLDPATPLTLPERLGVLGDASAAVSAGTLDASVVLARIAPLIALGDPHVTGQTAGVVASLDQDLVPDELRPNYVRMIHALYGATADRLGLAPAPGESADEKLLRPRVVTLVGAAGEDRALVDAALPMARRWIDDRTGIDPDLIDAVLGLAARSGGRPLFDQLHAAAKAEGDRERRGHLLAALGGFRDPELATAALDVALSGEFDVRETFSLVGALVGARETRESTWGYVQQHIETIQDAVPPIARGYWRYLGAAFCDAGHRAEVEAFFRPRVKAWLGGARTLDQVLEGIDLCAASAERQAPSIRSVLAGYPPDAPTGVGTTGSAP